MTNTCTPRVVDPLEAAGKTALAAALDAWQRRIVDPPRRTLGDPSWDDDRAFIDSIIRTKAGLNWPRCSNEVGAYRFDGDYEWCGAFAAYCWRAAGIDPVLAEVLFSSTYRLDHFGKRTRAFQGSERERLLDLRLTGEGRGYLRLNERSKATDVVAFGPRAGDILLVGNAGFGTHVCIVESFDAATGTFKTVEGNATGLLPDGGRAQGVVRQTRPVGSLLPHGYHARRLIRPALADLTTPPVPPA